jgi:hypothetical protein
MASPAGESPERDPPEPTSSGKRIVVPDWVRGRRRGTSFSKRFGLLGAGVVVVLAILGVNALVSLIPTPPPMPQSEPAAPVLPIDWDGGPSPALVLAYAGINYMNGGPADPVVELKIIVVNSGERHTESTSIRWEPSFAREYTFLKSEPPPWRVRTDEYGWGVYDGPGVLPERDGTYILWFTRTGFKVDEPRIQVIGNGTMFVDDTYAIAMNRILNREPRMQGAFERAPLADIVDRVGNAVPDVIETAPFGFALALAGTLISLVAGGMLASLRRAGAIPPQGTRTQ